MISRKIILDELGADRFITIAHDIHVEGRFIQNQAIELQVGGCLLYEEAPAVVLLTLDNNKIGRDHAKHIEIELSLLPEVARALAQQLIEAADGWSKSVPQ